MKSCYKTATKSKGYIKSLQQFTKCLKSINYKLQIFTQKQGLP